MLIIYSLSPSPRYLSSSFRSLSPGSAFISSQLRWCQGPPSIPPPALTSLLSFAFQVVDAAPHYRQGESGREREREREGGRAGGADAFIVASSRHCLLTSGAIFFFFFFSHEHQCVINRINLGSNFVMIAVLMYVNECSLLTHYSQFSPRNT